MVTVKKILNSITIAVAVAVIMLSLFARTPQLRKPRNGTVGENEPEMGISKKNSNNVAIKRSLPLIAENPLPPVKRSLPLIAEKPLPPIALVICAKNKHYLTEVTVLLKSAASLTTRTLRFIILTRSKKAFRKITSILNAWPEKYKRRIRLERHGVETSRKKKELSFCGSVGLFLPDILSEDDSAVLLKADSIFLRPPEQLLSQVHKFNGSHAIGVAQTLRGYIYQNPESRLKYPLPRGINTGVMIMNMTRLRALPTGWSNLVQEIYNRKKRRIGKVIVDGIINYLLAKNLELYYDLNCTWNYNTGTCVNELNSCMQAEETGIYLLSGIHSRYGGSKYYTKFHAVFEAWLRHRVGSGLSGLLKDITRRIRRDKPSEFWCNELSTMEYMLTKSLAVLAD